MSKTPLTDELCVRLSPRPLEALIGTLEFARKMERDRAELLEALKAVKHDLVGVTEIIANEAIAKAEKK